MTRRLVILCAVLISGLAQAQDSSARMFDRFWKVCSAAIDESTGFETTAKSLGMKAPDGGATAMTVGHQTIRPLMADEGSQSINVVVTKYADAREIECMSYVPVPTSRQALEQAIAPLSLDGDFSPTPGQTIGRWKRRGRPFVVITATSMSSSTVLTMRRIDIQ